MQKLLNPFSSMPGYYCFGCSPNNDHGLQLDFYEDGDEIVSQWNPAKFYQGFINVLHGGIQSTLMDEIASWVVFIKLETGGVTSRLTTRFKKPVLVNQGQITLRARLREQQKRIALIDVGLYSAAGDLCSESLAEYFVLPAEKAVKDMAYPGIDAFYDKD